MTKPLPPAAFSPRPTRTAPRTLRCSATTSPKTSSVPKTPSARTSSSPADTFTVVGVYEKQKTAFGGGKNPDDSTAYFPLATFHKLHPEILDYWISAKFDDQKNKDLVTEEIRELLRRRRKVRTEAEDNFAIFSSDSITKLWNQITGASSS